MAITLYLGAKLTTHLFWWVTLKTNPTYLQGSSVGYSWIWTQFIIKFQINVKLSTCTHPQRHGVAVQWFRSNLTTRSVVPCPQKEKKTESITSGTIMMLWKWAQPKGLFTPWSWTTRTTSVLDILRLEALPAEEYQVKAPGSMVVQWQYCCLTAYGPNSGWHLSQYLLK